MNHPVPYCVDCGQRPATHERPVARLDGPVISGLGVTTGDDLELVELVCRWCHGR